MNIKRTSIATAISFALFGFAAVAQAQQTTGTTPREDDDAATLDAIEVRGIRSSLEKSLEGKRNEDSVVEVITAEDVGKMPDKNVADSLARVPGVTTQSQSGGSGGFDENDRVSLRGTNPSLTQTLINGHSVASGDWFVLDQVGLVGRSVSYSLLPSELVSQVVVRKSATADVVEGGVAGAVDIITRKPLDFLEQQTLEGSLQAVYADLPDEYDPQISALFNWKNDANSFGVMLQAFHETRHLRRDGQEILGYAQIAPGSALATARPDLANVYYPTLIGSSFFEQERERRGGLIDLQLRPNESWEIDLTGFKSKMDASNYNRNWMFWGSRVIGGDNRVPNSYVVRNNTLVAATWNNVGTATDRAQYAIVDNILRKGAYAETDFFNLDLKWFASDSLTLKAKVGTTSGDGVTPVQNVFEGDVFNTGASYSFNGIDRPADVSFPSGNPANFTGTGLDWIFGASPASTSDNEDYAQFDGDWQIDGGAFTNVKFGLRWAGHDRDTHQVAQGPNFATDPFTNLPVWDGSTYPGDFGDDLGGNFPRNVWQLSPEELERWGNIHSNRDPVTRHYWPGEFSIEEEATAAYVMGVFAGDSWSGNVGVRFVQTKEDVLVNVAVPGSVCPALAACPSVPGAITSSAFGTFYQLPVEHTYDDILPSANFRWDLAEDLVGRLAISRTLSRPDYSAMGGALTADDTTNTGNGGNPDLEPIVANNFEGALEWYYGPRSLFSAGLFVIDLDSYVSFGTYQTELLNIRTGQTATYTISAPVNASGKVQGAELSWQSPIAGNFGGWANYTYADAEEDGGADLVGASENTYNVGAYWENERFGARVAYTYRSSFFVGLDRSSPQYQDDTGTLSASAQWHWNDRVSFTFEGLNLNNPTLKYYGLNEDQPRAFYVNGRQFYFGVRVSL
jgi:iron complex outermembrane receptor protein